MKKSLLILLIVVLAQHSKAQMYRERQTENIAFGGFISDIGGGGRIGYNYLFGNGLFIAPQIFGEWGRPFQASFSSYGADLGLGYSPFWLSTKMIFNLKGAFTGMYDNLKGLNQRHSGFIYGVRGGAELEYYVSGQDISLTLFGSQAYLLKDTFGKSRWEIGLMLKFTLY